MLECSANSSAIEDNSVTVHETKKKEKDRKKKRSRLAGALSDRLTDKSMAGVSTQKCFLVFVYTRTRRATQDGSRRDDKKKKNK